MYNIYLNKLENDEVRSILASGRFPTEDSEKWKRFCKAVKDDRVLAMLEFPFIDIELEMWSDGGDFSDAPYYDDKIYLDYAVCTSDSKGNWVIHDYIPEVSVDFSADDWKKRLVEDMSDSLEKYVASYGLSYTEPNE